MGAGGRILLILGTVGIWIGVYTERLADGVVTRKLCDPTILEEHENFAYITAWLFLVAVVIEMLRFFGKGLIASYPYLLTLAVILLMALGSAGLLYVGHLGPSLVYQQGAGVYHTTCNCLEFK